MTDEDREYPYVDEHDFNCVHMLDNPLVITTPPSEHSIKYTLSGLTNEIRDTHNKLRALGYSYDQTFAMINKMLEIIKEDYNDLL